MTRGSRNLASKVRFKRFIMDQSCVRESGGALEKKTYIYDIAARRDRMTVGKRHVPTVEVGESIVGWKLVIL